MDDLLGFGSQDTSDPMWQHWRKVSEEIISVRSHKKPEKYNKYNCAKLADGLAGIAMNAMRRTVIDELEKSLLDIEEADPRESPLIWAMCAEGLV
jgi:hypothetical protein